VRQNSFHYNNNRARALHNVDAQNDSDSCSLITHLMKISTWVQISYFQSMDVCIRPHPLLSLVTSPHSGLLSLANKHPGVLAEFSAGNFVVHKTSNKFSAIAFDHCHEKNKDIVKNSGGVIGLTNNPMGLKRWMVAGFEVSRILTECECHSTSHKDRNLYLHRDQQARVQAALARNVKSLLLYLKKWKTHFWKIY